MSDDEPEIEKHTLHGAESLTAKAGGASGDWDMGSWTGAPVATERDDLTGVVLGGTYRIVRMLGEGAMGRVYEAQHTRIEGKRFAVKVLHPEFVDHQELRVRFHREAEAAALIDHPNAVGVYDVGETKDGRPYIVSELLAGEDMIELLQRVGIMSVPSAVRVARQVAKALSAAHARGVIHRDVKPDNVFLTGDKSQPMAKVLDFGISRLDKSSNQLTKLGTVIGTPWYMPPEQGRGQRVDHRADIYGLGAILYRALTGVAPHDKGNPADTLVDVLTQELVPPRAVNPAIPEPLEAIIQKAMARNAADRHATMEELDRALAPFEAEATTDEPAPAGAAGPGAAAAQQGAGAAPGSTRPFQRRTGPGAAPTILTSASRLARRGGTQPDMEAAAGESQRWTLLLLGALAALGIFLGLYGAVIALVLLARGGLGGDVGAGAVVLVGLGVASAVAAAVAAATYRWRSCWHDPDLAARLVSRLQGPVLAGIGCYGLLAALLRAVEPSLQGRPIGLAWPVWDLLLLLLSLSAAGGVALTGALPASRRPWDRLVLLGAGLTLALIMVVAIVLLRGELRAP